MICFLIFIIFFNHPNEIYCQTETEAKNLQAASNYSPIYLERKDTSIPAKLAEKILKNKTPKNDTTKFFEAINVRKKSNRTNYDHVAYLEGILNNPVPQTDFLTISEFGNESMDRLLSTPLAATSTKPKNFNLGSTVSYTVSGCPDRCETTMHQTGRCMSPEQCYKLGGLASGSCCGNLLTCCRFVYYCGDTSNERLASFQSPNYPLSSRGSMACDFDLIIQKNVCAVRIDFVHVRMFEKMGGVCDVDQILILNSVDGPINSQCGDLTGYSTSVAVLPSQESPLKIVIIAQNEGHYFWDIRLRQIRCKEVSNFRKPPVCGSKGARDQTTSFYQLLDLWKNSAWHSQHNQAADAVWWREPTPIFNRFYYETTKKALSGLNNNHNAERRIINGEEAELHEFPWQVALVLKRVFFCGGALINEEYVLSAAHCFLTQDTPIADLVVFLGDHDLSSFNDTINDIRGIKQIHFHAHFHSLLLSNDIALIHLDRPVDFSQRIRPICMPDPNSSILGLTATVAGWGVTSYPNGKPNAVLQKLDVQVMSNEFCEAALNENLGVGNLCAIAHGQQGTCFGDSGGPLIVHHQGRQTLIGIVSFGITGCAVVPGLPDLYTRVSEYINWIDVATLK